MKLSRVVLVCLVLCVLGTSVAFAQGRGRGGVVPLGSLPPGYWSYLPEPTFCAEYQYVHNMLANQLDNSISVWVRDKDTRYPVVSDPYQVVDLGWNAHVNLIQGPGSASLGPFHLEGDEETISWKVIFTSPAELPFSTTVWILLTDDFSPSYPGDATRDPNKVRFACYDGNGL